jgi:hypothetical protein
LVVTCYVNMSICMLLRVVLLKLVFILQMYIYCNLLWFNCLMISIYIWDAIQSVESFAYGSISWLEFDMNMIHIYKSVRIGLCHRSCWSFKKMDFLISLRHASYRMCREEYFRAFVTSLRAFVAGFIFSLCGLSLCGGINIF